MITFKYRAERGEFDEVVYRPVATVEFLSRNGEWIRAHPYIDSGADVTLLPLSLGRLLGLEIKGEELRELRGVSGHGVPVVFYSLCIKIGSFDFEAHVAWALIEEVPPLLGRSDVFDHFDVTFKQRDREIVFEERNA